MQHHQSPSRNPRSRHVASAALPLIAALCLSHGPAGAAVGTDGVRTWQGDAIGGEYAGGRLGYVDMRPHGDGFVLAGFVTHDAGGTTDPAATDAPRDYVLTRIASDGKLDESFGNHDGHYVTDIDGKGDTPTALAVDGDDRIIVVGHDAVGGAAQVLRLDRSGEPDPAGGTSVGFDGDGRISPLGTAPGSDCHRVWDVAITRIAAGVDYAIVLAGASFSPDSNGDCPADSAQTDAFVARLYKNGELDTNLDGGDGVLRLGNAGFDQFRSVAVRGNGRIVAGGAFGGSREAENRDDDLFVADFPAMPGTGEVRTFVHDAAGNGNGDRVFDVEVDGRGRIVFAGFADLGDADSGASTALVGRLDDAYDDQRFGFRRDGSFGGTGGFAPGLAGVDLGDGIDFFTDVEFAGAGRLLVVGADGDTPASGDSAGERAGVVARLEADGGVDPSFTAGNHFRYAPGAADDRQNGRAVSTNGESGLMIAGSIDTGDDPAVADAGFVQALTLTDQSRNDPADIDGTSGGSGDAGGTAAAVGSGSGGGGSDDDGGGGGGGPLGPVALLLAAAGLRRARTRVSGCFTRMAQTDPESSFLSFCFRELHHWHRPCVHPDAAPGGVKNKAIPGDRTQVPRECGSTGHPFRARRTP